MREQYVKKFAERLSCLRKELQLSKKELAEAIEISYTTINYWENNKGLPTKKNIVKLVKFFSVSADYLLGLED